MLAHNKKAQRSASGLVWFSGIFLPWSGERQRRHGFLAGRLAPGRLCQRLKAGGDGAFTVGLSPLAPACTCHWRCSDQAAPGGVPFPVHRLPRFLYCFRGALSS